MTINDSIYGLARLLTQVSLGLLGCENEGNSWLVSAVLDYADSNNWGKPSFGSRNLRNPEIYVSGNVLRFSLSFGDYCSNHFRLSSRDMKFRAIRNPC
jgi:hypothetical protein